MADSNAGRDVQKHLNKFDLGLNVPRETLNFPVGNGAVPIELPWIRPTSWVAFLIEKYPKLLCGTARNAEAELDTFWSLYRKVHPQHAAFKGNEARLRRTIPLLLHGDEGRYLKKSHYMLCTLESPLGMPSPNKRKGCKCDCAADSVLRRYADLHVSSDVPLPKLTRAGAQCTNATGHVFLSKFLLFGMASKQYKENPSLLHAAFELVSKDLKSLCEDGVVVPGKGVVYGGFLGVKGDLKFHHQIGHLSQSYFNLGKKQELPICHLCNAGSAGVPFESLDDDPLWERSMQFVSPWKNGTPPSLTAVPFEAASSSAIFRLDPFHLWKVGLGRDLNGSGLILLCHMGKFDFEADSTRNIDDRLCRAHSCFRMWCMGSGKTAALRSFTKNNLMYPDQLAFAWGNWKGSDNTLITQWLLFFITCQMRASEDAHEHRLIKALSQSLSSAVEFWRILHSHSLWLSRECGQRAQHHLSCMLRGYKRCAYECHQLGFAGFGLKPKLHGLHHVSKDMLSQLRSGSPKILNPLIWSCESNEDMVGRVSRLARKVSARLVNHRVFDRIMFKSKALLRKKGMA